MSLISNFLKEALGAPVAVVTHKALAYSADS